MNQVGTMNDEWPSLVQLLRSYCQRKYGWPPIGLTVHLPHGEAHREPIPLPLAREHAPPPSPMASWASGAEPKHLSDFQKVYWPGLGTFDLTPKQRAVVKMLWEAMEAGTHEVGQVELLRGADSDGPRLRDLFGRSAAWGSLVVLGASPATYRLPVLPDPEEGPDDAA